MSKIYKVLKKTGVVLLIILVILIVSSLIVVTKGNNVTDKINEFKNRSEYVGTYIVNINKKKANIAYYKVTKQFDYEINDDRRLYSNSNTDNIDQKFTDFNIGDVGDIYLSSGNPFGLLYTEWMSKKIYIGHAGIVSNVDASMLYESTGKGKENKGVHKLKNDWLTTMESNIIIIRNKTIINKKEIQNWLEEKENLKYNYLFFVKAKNRYYCTDLVSRCYEESLSKKISKNNIFVTGESMIGCDDNFIIYYREKSNKENIDYNVYYLE